MKAGKTLAQLACMGLSTLLKHKRTALFMIDYKSYPLPEENISNIFLARTQSYVICGFGIPVLLGRQGVPA